MVTSVQSTERCVVWYGVGNMVRGVYCGMGLVVWLQVCNVVWGCVMR